MAIWNITCTIDKIKASARTKQLLSWDTSCMAIRHYIKRISYIEISSLPTFFSSKVWLSWEISGSVESSMTLIRLKNLHYLGLHYTLHLKFCKTMRFRINAMCGAWASFFTKCCMEELPGQELIFRALKSTSSRRNLNLNPISPNKFKTF